MADKAYSGTLASLSEQQTYPRMAKPSEFSVKEVKTSQDGTEKNNVLLSRTAWQDAPRHNEDAGPGKSGAGTPTFDRTSSVASGFKVAKTPDEGSSVSNPSFVDFKTGQHSCTQK